MRPSRNGADRAAIGGPLEQLLGFMRLILADGNARQTVIGTALHAFVRRLLKHFLEHLFGGFQIALFV